MQFASIVAAAGIGLACCTLAAAGGSAGQAGSRQPAAEWTEAQSLRELPAGVQVLLGVGLSPHDGGIADRGENFNASDVWADGMPPSRRFSLGLVHGNQVLVALEQGGRAHQFKTLEFKQVGATWEPVRCLWARSLPQRRAELLELAATPPSRTADCPVAGALPSSAHH